MGDLKKRTGDSKDNDKVTPEKSVDTTQETIEKLQKYMKDFYRMQKKKNGQDAKKEEA